MRTSRPKFFVVVFSVLAISIGAAAFAQSIPSYNQRGFGEGNEAMVQSILSDTVSAQPTMRMAPAIESPASLQSVQATYIAADGAGAAQTTALEPTESDRDSLVRSILESDARIRSIDVSDTHVRVQYEVKAKTLRFFNLQGVVHVGVYPSLEVSTKVPWFVKRSQAQSLRSLVQAGLPASRELIPFTISEQIAIVSTIHSSLQQTF
jgi:hypothetical protein